MATLPAKQYAFRDGHWVDQWNEGLDDTAPRPDLTGSWPEAILPICGCGNPEIVVAAVLEYMERAQAWYENIRGPHDLSLVQIRPEHQLADLLLAYLADEVGLTEHGGNIYWSWPTDAGRRWMELAKENREGSST